MILLAPDEIRAGNIPPEWAERIEVRPDGLRITGNPYGAGDLFLHASERGLAIAERAAEIVAHLRAAGTPVALERESLCFLLQAGFVVRPRTIFAGIFLLGIGDVAHVSLEGSRPALRFEVDFPWFADRSRQDRVADPAALRDQLAHALERACEGASAPVLLMSSGKDSTAAAIGAARAGVRDLHCLTFVGGVAADEHLDARRFCDRLGLRHDAVPLPDDPETVSRQLLELYSEQDMPCADFSQIAYHACLVQAGVRDGRVLDGAGNDVYMGHVPSRRDMRILRLRLGRNALADALRPLRDHASRLNFLLQTRTETMFPGYGFRQRETRHFFPASVDTTPYWKRTDEAYAERDIFDLRAATRGRHYDQGAMVLKARGAVQARGSTLRQPYSDAEVVEGYFHLPEADRFDREALVNKITLRRMLRAEIDYDDAAIGKRIFAFDAPGFLVRNRDFVREQIRACELWTDSIERPLDDWLDRVPQRPRLAQALLALLALSGWLNHARVLGGGAPEIADTPIDARV